jgi:hypothetical protein
LGKTILRHVVFETGISIMLDFPILMVVKVSWIVRPEGQLASSFGSNSTGLSRCTGPVLARHDTLTDSPFGIITFFFEVLTAHRKNRLERIAHLLT